MNQRGYTLMELLLYVVISASLLTGVSVFFGIAADARIKNQSISEVEQQGQAAITYMAQTIRNATSITAPTIGSSAGTLTLVVPTGSLSPTVFSVASNVLQVQEGSGAVVALTNSKVQVTSLTFTNVSRSSTVESIRISMTIKRVNSSGRNEYDYTETFNTTAALR